MSDNQTPTPEERVRNLETAARMQSHMNMALSNCIDELYAMVKAITPEAVDGEPTQPLTGLEYVRQLLAEQQNGAAKPNNTIEFIRKLNQDRHDKKQS